MKLAESTRLVRFFGALTLTALGAVLFGGGCMKRSAKPEYYRFLSTSKIDDLKALDPSLVRVILEYHLIHNLTTQLIALDGGGQYQPQLAEKVDFSADKKSVTIHLSSKTFNNGEPITSADVAGTIKRLIVRGSPHSAPRKFIKGAPGLKRVEDSCEGIEAKDPRTIVLRFNYPVKDILYYFQLADYGILHKSQYGPDRDLTLSDWGTTSGPYSLRKDEGEYHLRWNESYGPGDKRIQKLKASVSDGTDNLREQIKNRKIHMGTVGFQDYYRLIQTPDAIEHIELVGSKYTAVSILLLNVSNPKFKRTEARRWIQRRMMARLQVLPKYKNLLEKSYQYFLPGAPGYMDPAEARKVVDGFGISDEVPPEFKDGITIRCRSALATYLPEELEALLQEALGVRIHLHFDIPSDQYRDVVKARDFEVMLMNPSMSYKVLGESLTLGYVTEPRHFLDPSGEVRANLEHFNQAVDPAEETKAIRRILIAMTKDAEVIPLYYSGYMKFYDKELLDAAEVSFSESFQIHKYRVK